MLGRQARTQRWATLLLAVTCLAACAGNPGAPGPDESPAVATTGRVTTVTPSPSSTPAPSTTPSPTATSLPTSTVPPPTPTSTEVVPTPALVSSESITFTIVYDNEVDDPRLTNAWGFACYIETPELTILFDTGGDGPTLLENMAILGKDPAEIDVVVLSHRHGDHVGGLPGLLAAGATPEVYMLASFPDDIRRPAKALVDVIDVTSEQAIAEGVWTTGQVVGSVPEQALVVETAEGWVLVTGCAHPGVARMASQAIAATRGPITLVIGGFHLGRATPTAIQTTIERLQAEGVAEVAPTHCTGAQARDAFSQAFGEAYHAAGAGTSWVYGAPPPSN